MTNEQRRLVAQRLEVFASSLRDELGLGCAFQVQAGGNSSQSINGMPCTKEDFTLTAQVDEAGLINITCVLSNDIKNPYSL